MSTTALYSREPRTGCCTAWTAATSTDAIAPLAPLRSSGSVVIPQWHRGSWPTRSQRQHRYPCYSGCPTASDCWGDRHAISHAMCRCSSWWDQTTRSVANQARASSPSPTCAAPASQTWRELSTLMPDTKSSTKSTATRFFTISRPGYRLGGRDARQTSDTCTSSRQHCVCQGKSQHEYHGHIPSRQHCVHLRWVGLSPC